MIFGHIKWLYDDGLLFITNKILAKKGFSLGFVFEQSEKIKCITNVVVVFFVVRILINEELISKASIKETGSNVF